MSANWTAADIPDQRGRTAIVTGANSGIGLEAARELARKGAHVVLACRDADKATRALDEIRTGTPDAQVEAMSLDLADLDQVAAFSQAFLARHPRLDLLINNAGVMTPPRSTTVQGYELQFGVNHLGHFALTGLLIERLLATEGARIVNVSSIAHKGGQIDFDDLDFEQRGYQAMKAYCNSKLANLLFTLELTRRLEKHPANLIAVAAHPGWTRTNLQQYQRVVQWLNPVVGMQAADGALPTLLAATSPKVGPNDYFGPTGLLDMRGPPGPARRTRAARNTADAERLWQVSEQRTGIHFPL